MNLDIRKPLEGELEITVIGTGGGYGESLVVYDGLGGWIIVDSCVSPKDKKNLPLEYLNHLSVDLSKEVKLIVCTHWHDDHIQGISEIYEQCTSAEVAFGQAHDQNKFLQFVNLDGLKAKNSASESSTTEFNRILSISKQRQKTFKRAQADNLLYSTFNFGDKFEIFALSPSSATLDNFDLEISELIEKVSPRNIKWVNDTPNDKSVALLLRRGPFSAILGADLEVGSNADAGWLNVLENVICIKQTEKSSYFKIPHHGSENGYDSRLWEKLLLENPVGTLTPWNRNKGLPTIDMVNVYQGHSTTICISSASEPLKAKARGHKMEKLFKKLGLVIKEVQFRYGVIRYRIDLNGEKPEGRIEMDGAATFL